MPEDARRGASPLPPDDASERARFERHLRELQAENAALSTRVDQLIRRIEHLNGLIANMSRAGQMLRVARASIRRPGSLARLPIDLVRVARAPASPSDAAAQEHRTGRAGAIAAAKERQVTAAVQAHERRLSGTRHDLARLKVALIADDHVAQGLVPECEVIAIDPLTWRQTLSDRRPDLLLVQSAWRGQAGAWQYRVAWFPYPDSYRLEPLRSIIAWCQAAGIPTVFWATEDPVHLDRFSQAAELFDHVFTVAPGSVERLADLPGRAAARVAHLPMAVQPRVHHPTGLMANASGAALIGSSYLGLPLEDREDLGSLLDAAARYDLAIYDRKLGSDPRLFGFPARHRASIRPWLPLADIPDTIRRSRVILATPMAGAIPARVFESLASGRPVVTSSRAAAAWGLGHGVFGGSSVDELDRVLASVMAGGPTIDAAMDAAIVETMRDHTYRQRLAAIAREVGFDVAAGPPSVSLLALADDAAAWREVVEVADQLAGWSSEVIVGTTLDNAPEVGLDRLGERAPVRIVQQAEGDVQARLRRLGLVTTSPWVHISTLAPRSRRSLEPLLAATTYADADVIGAAASRADAYTLSARIDPVAAIVRRTTLVQHGWPAERMAVADRAWFETRELRVYAIAPDGGAR